MKVEDLVICGEIVIFGKWYRFLWPPVVFEIEFNSVRVRGDEFMTNIDLGNLMEILMNSKL